MTENSFKNKLESILMRYDQKESNGILTQGEYDEILQEILKLYNRAGERLDKIKILNNTYYVYYDPERYFKFNMESLKKNLGKRINQITYSLNLKDGIKTKISMRLVRNSLSEKKMCDNDFNNSYNEYNKEYIEITKVSLFTETSSKKIKIPKKSNSKAGYGICKRCGKPIPAGRLTAVPGAENCVECIEAVQKNNPRKRLKMKDNGISGSREDVKRGRARSWGDH